MSSTFSRPNPNNQQLIEMLLLIFFYSAGFHQRINIVQCIRVSHCVAVVLCDDTCLLIEALFREHGILFVLKYVN